MKEALFIILGWLLGLLGVPIVSRIEKYYRRKDIKKAIFSELKNTEIRLAATYYKILMHLGIRDKSSLSWLKNIYEQHRADCPKDILEAMEKILQAPDGQFNAVTSFLKAADNMSLGLKTFSLPFTESILEHLSVFDTEFQKDIFEVRDKIGLLNEEIENAMFYFRLTFDPTCMNVNKDIIRINLKDDYTNIQKICRGIVDKIEKILKKEA